MGEEKFTSLSAIPTTAGTRDMRVRVGLLFKKAGTDQEPGFDGTQTKDGVLVVRVGSTGTMDDFARTFAHFNGGQILPFNRERDGYGRPIHPEGRFIRSWKMQDGREEDRRPRLSTTLLFKLRTECDCLKNGGICYPGEVKRAAREAGVQGKDVIDILNHGVCPVCGSGKLLEWKQLDPFEDSALTLFDDAKDDDGNFLVGPEGQRLGWSGKERMEKLLQTLRPIKKDEESDEEFAARVAESDKVFEKDFVPPGVVALSRCAFGEGEEPECLPDTAFYKWLQEEAHKNVAGNGQPDPLRVDLLNCLDPSEAILVGLNFAAPEYTFGSADFNMIDQGLKSPEDSNYKVSLKVRLQDALKGIPPRQVGSAFRPGKPKRKVKTLRVMAAF